MKVATWQGGPRFTVDEAPEPVAGAKQVVVAVQVAGITQLRFTAGTDSHGNLLPAQANASHGPPSGVPAGPPATVPVGPPAGTGVGHKVG